MGKKLVIVESPSKSKTIGKYLGEDYKVVASVGHIRDLATSGQYGFGVDIENGFKPNYIVDKGKKKIVSELKKDVKSSDMVYLASDPDREGEAIAWHLKDTLGIDDKNYKRVLFHEITKDKVIDAINNPTVIDENLVHSQETRRILDRIIGFRLSKLMQSKIGAKSAGRVQSVALKLIVDREEEIKNFIPEEYWTITAQFPLYEAELKKYKTENIELKSEDEVNHVLDNLGKLYTVEAVEMSEKGKKSKLPFTTSTLQQLASSKLGFNPRRTMSTAQKLYEGIDIGSETVGLITYMRTDSTRLSDEFVGSCMKYIETEFGKEYVGYVKTLKKKDNIQDAHEGIRPTSVKRTPESLKGYLDTDEYKLYSLIYKRAVASLMADAKMNATTITLDNNDYKFVANGHELVFDGYLRIYSDYEESDDRTLPKVGEKEEAEALNLIPEQHFTKPLPRYNEASLIKDLEEKGIGRPSTYAATIEIIKDKERGYTNMEDKRFIPTDIGCEITNKLQERFSDLINVEYTANMETNLDKIAEGELVWNEILKEFWDEFEPRVKEAYSEMEKKAPEEVGEDCPECGSPLVKRKGRYGEFVACSNYPECKYIKKEEVEIITVCDCPNCNGHIIERKSKRGKVFYGCDNYPKCKTAYWDKPTGEACPDCGKMLVTKNDTVKCSECEFEK